MTVLVTGAGGFIGLNIAEALLGRGDTVILYDRAPMPPGAAAAFASLPGEARPVAGDVRDADAVTDTFRRFRPDRVVHAAAVTPGRARERERTAEAIEVNVTGTHHVLQAAADTGIDRLVQLSSAAVYGGNACAHPRLDEAATAPDPDSVYAITKYAAERLALGAGRRDGIGVVAARLGAAFGPWERDTGVRDTLSPILQVVGLAQAGRPVLLPRAGRRDWIYGRDVGAAVAALVERADALPDVVNIGPGHEWTVAAWCARMAADNPGFAYRLADDPAAATVDYHGDRDRAPLAIERLAGEVGYRPRFGLDEAYADYMRWIGLGADGHGGEHGPG